MALICCAAVQKGTEVLEQAGKISAEDKQLINKMGDAIGTSFRDLSEEEEFYIGRSVAAQILSRYKVWNNQVATNYVNLITQALALFSDRPEIYAGYHALILDSEEINAMAAPGGFIFLTRGLLQLCPDEDTLASVLAHEIAHISSRHGLQAIKKARLMEVFKLLAEEASGRLAPERIKKLTELFEGALDDIVGQLIEKGYDRKQEYEADALATALVRRAGYSPAGLVYFLEILSQQEVKGKGLKGWFSTHPRPQERREKIKTQLLSTEGKTPQAEARKARFQKVAAAWQ